MPRTRNNVWKLGDPWHPTVLWYAKAVARLRQRGFDKRNSWSFLGAMHGVDLPLWRTFGYFRQGDPLPSDADQRQFWAQCQHQSWYFLPWHRGYLAAFEAIVRAAVVELGGPADWALPYWNYSEGGNSLKLPPAFAQQRLPDGSENMLFVARRYGGDGRGNIVIRPEDVDLRRALQSRNFVGGSEGGSTGFGGAETVFRHGGPRGANGQLESQPHNVVHGLVGGLRRGGNQQDSRDYGLMSMPDTAALDPIFWLHHCNIDRLWEVWRLRRGSLGNPAAAAWLNGPAAGRKFVVPGPQGEERTFTPAQMRDTTAPNLDYVYDDVSDPLGGATRLETRLVRFGLAPAGAIAEGAVVTPPARVELVGASEGPLRLGEDAADTSVRMSEQAPMRMAAVAGAAAGEPDRIFLNLENIQGKNDAAVFYVYVGLPEGANPADHPEFLAGAISLFGAEKASLPDVGHGGSGLNEVLEITSIVDSLHARDADLARLPVKIVPRTDTRAEDEISIGRISIYRQGE